METAKYYFVQVENIIFVHANYAHQYYDHNKTDNRNKFIIIFPMVEQPTVLYN